MIVLKYRESCKCVKYFSPRDIYRRFCSTVATVNATNSELESKVKDSSILDPSARIGNAETKIIYSSILHRNHILSWNETRKLIRKQAIKARRERQQSLKERLLPISVKFMEGFSLQNESSCDHRMVGLPITMEDNAKLFSYDEQDEIVETEANGEIVPTIPATSSTNSSLKAQDKNELVEKSCLKRNASCGGCGARIQCEDQYNPGFIPLEFLSSLNRSQLSLILCQRCYFTRSLKVSMQVNFSPFSYLKEVEKLKSRRSLILAVFDVTDISHSISTAVSDYVGKRHPIILVGNKVDLLPPDSHGYLNRVREHIKEFFKSNQSLNVKDVFLVSSASGIGIENLISKLFSIWKNYGDIYLVGHTNVGKSSLFNALLKSDLCKALRSGGIQSATTSPWPGTTLGILKFPVSRPTGIFMLHRMKRLQLEHMEKRLVKMESSRKKKHNEYLASPDSFSMSNLEDINCEMGTNAVSSTIMPLSQEKIKYLGLSTSRLMDDNVRWCHDTPGIPHSERTLDFLTPDEMRYALPGTGMIIPRTFYVKVGLSLFIGGLARIDYKTGDHPICLTVFASSKLPVVVCTTENAEEIYAALLGTHLFGIPRGEQGRLEHWPPLAFKDYEVIGLGLKESCSDVLLSSAGWMAITAGRGMMCSIRAHTPRGFGIHLRTPSLMPYSILQKGPRRRDSPAYPPLREHLFTKYL